MTDPMTSSVSVDLAIIYDKLRSLQSLDLPEDVMEYVERATDSAQTAMFRAAEHLHGFTQKGQP